MECSKEERFIVVFGGGRGCKGRPEEERDMYGGSLIVYCLLIRSAFGSLLEIGVLEASWSSGRASASVRYT